MNFADFNLSPQVLQALQEMNFQAPTPIQEQIIPLQRQGRDVIGQAQTGTGKTAAFGIPLMEILKTRTRQDGPHSCDALILTPTRELALQVTEEIRKIGQHCQISVLPIYGGTSIETQIRALRQKVNVVVATPGRALDHLSRGTLDLSGVKHFILDEADEMLDMGFVDDIVKIMQSLPEERQMLLFSATMPPEIKRIAERHMHDPVHISVSRAEMIVPKIEQVVHLVEDWERFEALCRILDCKQAEMTIIFCATKREVDELYRKLRERHYQAEALHGDFSQNQRDQVMAKFRSNEIDILIATDLAARGLDVSNVELVVNYQLPQSAETYVHRIGRTGRAGRSGTAVTFISNGDFKALDVIQKLTKVRLRPQTLPSQKDLYPIRKVTMQKRIEGFVNHQQAGDFLDLATQLLEQSAPVEALAATLKFAFEAINPPLRVDQEGKLNAETTGAERGMVRFFLNAGRNIDLTARDILRTITRLSNISGDKVGKIRVQEDFTFLEVDESVAEQLLEKMPSFRLQGLEISLRPARAKDKVARIFEPRKERRSSGHGYQGSARGHSAEALPRPRRRFSQG